MKKSTLLLIFMVATMQLFAENEVEAFRQNTFKPKPGYIYTLVEVNADLAHYKQKAKQEAFEALSSQLYTQVSSDKTMTSFLKNEKTEEIFLQHTFVTTSLPIHGAKEVGHMRRGFSYFLLMALDTKMVAPLYKKTADTLAQQIDMLFHQYKKASSLSEKTAFVEKLNEKYTAYEKNAMVASLFGENNIKIPELDTLTLEMMRKTLLSVDAVNEEELALLVTKKLSLKGFKYPVKIYPLSYENKGTFSPFSSSFKNYMTRDLSSEIKVTNAADAPYKLKGNYFLKGHILKANIFLEDAEGLVKKSVIATLNLTPEKDYKKNNSLIKMDPYYVPKKNEFDTMDAVVSGNMLTVRAKVNAETDGLLFHEGDFAALEVQTSQAAYVYVIANMRMKNGMQVQYLLPVGNNDENPYMHYISDEDAGKWVTLIQLTATAPYGSEAFHVWATNKKIRLPRHAIKNIDGIEYEGVIVNTQNEILEASRSIAQERSFNRGFQKKNDVSLERSEALVKMTTLP